MKSLHHELADVKTRDEFHTITQRWCNCHRFSYDMSVSITRNIKSARTSARFVVAVALTEAAKIYERLG